MVVAKQNGTIEGIVSPQDAVYPGNDNQSTRDVTKGVGQTEKATAFGTVTTASALQNKAQLLHCPA
jgi:hypothetical protein